MGFFGKTSAGQVARLEEVTRDIDGLYRSVAELQKEVEALRTPIRDLTMEWEDWFEKFRSLYGRISKRQQREDVKEPGRNGPERISPLAEALLRGGQ